MKIKPSFNVWNIGKWLLVACILWSPLVGVNDLIDAFAGVENTLTLKTGPFTRIVRDSLIVLFYLYFFWAAVLSNRIKWKINNNSFLLLILSFISLLSILLSSWYSLIILKVPQIAVFLGLKTFIYAPLFLISYVFLMNYPEALLAIRRSALLVLVFEVVLGLIQVRFMPPMLGGSILGSYPIGTFTHYNIYGSFLCLFLFAHLFINNFRIPNLLLGLIIFLIIASGSRQSILVFFFLVGLWYFQNYAKGYLERGMLVSIFPLILFLAFFVLSIITQRGFLGWGHEQVGLQGDPRWQIWANYLGRDLTFSQVTLGSGVGLASSAVTVFLGHNFFKGQFIADSMHLALLAQYGLIGLFFIYLTLFCFLCEYYKSIGLIFMGVIGLYGFGLNFFEVYPANMLFPIILSMHRIRYSS